MARSEVSAVLYVILALLFEPCSSASARSIHPGTLDDVIEHGSVVKPGALDSSPGSVASSVSLSPLSPPLHAGDKLFFNFEELPPAASTDDGSHSAGILLKSPHRRASVGGRVSSTSSQSRPPLSRARLESHPPMEAPVPADRVARFARLVSDFERAALMNARRRFDHFLQITNQPIDIAQWIVSSTPPEFQLFYHETVFNLTHSLDSPDSRSGPYVDWRVLSLNNLHQALIASFPLRSYKSAFAITQQLRVTLKRISSNKPLEFISRITALVGQLNNSKIFRHGSIGGMISRLVSCLIRAIDGQVVQPEFIEMVFSALNTVKRIWSQVHDEATAPSYINVVGELLAQHMESFDIMAQWVTPTESDEDVDRFLMASETACTRVFQRLFQIESVLDTIGRLSNHLRLLFRNVPVEIPGATRESLDSPSFLFALFNRMSADQLDDYLILISKFISDDTSVSLTEVLALNLFLWSELSARSEGEVPTRITAVRDREISKLDRDVIVSWLGRREESRCKSPIDYEIVGLLVGGTVVFKARNLPSKMTEEWKSTFRSLVRAVNVLTTTDLDAFTVSVLIPARTTLQHMQSYQ